MVSAEILAKLPGQSGGPRYKVKAEGYGTICHADHWAFSSCGVDSLFGFNSGYDFWGQKENTDKFVEFLTNKDFMWPQGNGNGDEWQTHEYMFALANNQFMGWEDYKDPKKWDGKMRHLVLHPKVKLVDKFYNKAHGPQHMYIFRLSAKKDFKEVKW